MSITRRSFLKHMGQAGVALGAASIAQANQGPSNDGTEHAAVLPASRRQGGPNVVFILTDQHNINGLGCYGGPDVVTPHLDTLAGQGVRFNHAYCQATVCVPNRAAIFTGRYPNSIGVLNNHCDPPLHEEMIPWYLAHHGYVTGGYGKTHFGSNHERGFMETGIGFDVYNEYLASHGIEHRYPWPAAGPKLPYCGPVGDSPIPTEHSFATWVTDNGLDFVKRHKDEPFFLYLGYYGPHQPYQAPPEYAQQYDPKALHLPPRITREQCRLRPSLISGANFLSEDDIRRVTQQYLGLCTHIDNQIGRVMAELDRLGLGENTVVIFSADHGDHMGAANRYGKGMSMHNSCMRIPLLMRYPKMFPQGRVVEDWTRSIDILPTILNLTGVNVPDRIHGETLVDLATGKAGRDLDVVFASKWRETNGTMPLWGQTAALTRQHKMIWWNTGECEFYDLEKDPLEYENRAGAKAYRDAQYEMQQHLQDWTMRTQDYPGRTGRNHFEIRRLAEQHMAFGKKYRQG